jgi:hypothetical protein
MRYGKPNFSAGQENQACTVLKLRPGGNVALSQNYREALVEEIAKEKKLAPKPMNLAELVFTE